MHCSYEPKRFVVRVVDETGENFTSVMMSQSDPFMQAGVGSDVVADMLSVDPDHVGKFHVAVVRNRTLLGK